MIDIRSDRAGSSFIDTVIAALLIKRWIRRSMKKRKLSKLNTMIANAHHFASPDTAISTLPMEFTHTVPPVLQRVPTYKQTRWNFLIGSKFCNIPVSVLSLMLDAFNKLSNDSYDVTYDLCVYALSNIDYFQTINANHIATIINIFFQLFNEDTTSTGTNESSPESPEADSFLFVTVGMRLETPIGKVDYRKLLLAAASLRTEKLIVDSKQNTELDHFMSTLRIEQDIDDAVDATDDTVKPDISSCDCSSESVVLNEDKLKECEAWTLFCYQLFDGDKDGEVSITEFCSLIHSFLCCYNISFTVNHHQMQLGFLTDTRRNFSDMITASGKMKRQNKHEYKQMMYLLDKLEVNSEGKVTYQEFKKWVIKLYT